MIDQTIEFMTKFLRFTDIKLEEEYNAYFEIDLKQKFRIFIYIEYVYAMAYILNYILQYFYSNDEYLAQELWLFINIGCILLIFCIFLTLSLLVINKKLSSVNGIDILIFIIAVIIQFVFDNPYVGSPNNNACIIERGYQAYWEGYAVQFHNVIICNLFNKWIYKFLYFGATSTYFYIYKHKIVEDEIIGTKIMGFVIAYGIMVYYFERAYRMNYMQLRKVIQKEKMWKDITDSLPEGVLIMNKESNSLYINHILKSYLDKLETNRKENENKQEMNKEKEQEKQGKNDNNDSLCNFLDKVINLKLRNSLDDLKTRYKKSLGIYKKANRSGSNSEMQVIPDSIIDQEINKYHPPIKGFTLNDFIKFTNHTDDSQHLFSIDDFITFDSSFQEKSLEIKVKNIQLEGELVLLIIFIDTTHRDLIARLEQNDKYKNIILSTVSHELRTPLNSAISLIQTAIESTNTSKIDKNELLNLSLKSLNILTSLINDILDYSQIQANKLNLVFQNVDLRQVIYDAHALFKIQCNKKNIDLIVDIAEEVPSFIRTDPNRLTQIILNLLSNAIKFTKKGYVKISVKWDNLKHGKATIAVEDTGIGIKPEEQSKLFQEYGKIDLGENAKMNPTGCGLGLSISHKLAMRLSGGDSGGIKVESQIDKGSIFSFTIENKQDSKGTESILNLISCDAQTFSPKKPSSRSSSVGSKQIENSPSLRILSKKSRNKSSNKVNFFQNINNQLELEEGNRKAILKNKPMKFMNLYDAVEDRSSPYGTNRSLLYDNNQAVSCCERWKILSNNPRLLIIDDDAINLYAFTLIAKYLNYECNTACSAEEGLKLLQKENVCRVHAPYDIIFIDFNMPDIDGLAATKIIKNMILKDELPLTFIVGCTAILNEEIQEKGIESGMDYVVEKPITKDKLFKIITMFKKDI